MAKAPASDSIMAVDKMKPLLALSKKEPVQAAIGLTSDGEGLILLDKKAKPKKVFSMLKASAGKSKLQLNTSSLRYGRAEVDTEYDAGMVRFFINKDAPGNLRMKLVEVVKRIPYSKVEINVDPSLEAEPEEDQEGVAPTNGASAVAPAAAAEPLPPPPVQPAAAVLDPAALRRDLAGLIARIGPAAGTDAARKGLLVTLATQGNDALKSSNLEAAAQSIARLREALDNPAVTAPTAAGPKSAQVWADAKDAVDQQLEGLYGLLKKTGLPVLIEVAAEIESVLANFRTGLITSLINFDSAAGQAKETARAEALKSVADYKARLTTDKHVLAADKNPFGVSITVGATLGAALDRLQRQLAA